LPTWVFLGCLALLALQWARHFQGSFDALKPYDGLQHFGDRCDYTTGLWLPGTTFDAVRTARHEFTPQTMPYRSAAQPPRVPLDGYIFIRCHVDLSSLPRDAAAWLNVGSVVGESAVYVDGRFKLRLDATRYLVEVPLTPDERGADTVVTVISKNAPSLRFPGLGSLMPMVVGTGVDTANHVQALITFSAVELPASRMSFALGLMLIFGVAWLVGSRYADVGWVIVLTAVLVLWNFVDNVASVTLPPLVESTLYTACKLAFALALPAFTLTFLRVRHQRLPLEAAFVALTLAGTAAYAWLNKHDLVSALDVTICASLISAATLAAGCAGALHLARGQARSRRRRIHLYAAVNALGALGYALQCTWLDQRGLILSPYLNFALVTAFALFLGMDLVVFQRGYFNERSHRERATQEKDRLLDQLRLGRAVQSLYLPRERSGAAAGFEFAFDYEPHEELAGDWLSHWTAGDDAHVFLLGDVTGKGPSAALAVATIAALVNESRAQGLDAVRCVEKINAGLHELLGAHLVSTLSALVVHRDGRIQYAAAGAVGWIVVGPAGMRALPARGALLGLAPDLALEWRAHTLAPGEALVTFSDGVIDGAKALRRAERALAGDASKAGVAPAVGTLIDTLKALATREGIADDRTILAVRRPPTALTEGAALGA
jgi:hypothetical protein